MVLTGRPVDAAEAYGIGLANRVVPRGEARAAAEELAASLARFPQTCLRTDLASLRGQQGLPERQAMVNEFAHSQDALTEAREGAARFAAGEGRHGDFSGTGGPPPDES